MDVLKRSVYPTFGRELFLHAHVMSMSSDIITSV